jgi:hypothetical protein
MERRMASIRAWMTASLLLTAILSTGFLGVFALAGTVASHSTSVKSAFELLTTYFAAPYVFQPTWLILHEILAAETRLGSQEGAFGTALGIHMTVMGYLRMAAALLSLAFKSTWRRLSAAGQRRLKHSTSAMAADFVENCLATAVAWTLMTELLTSMASAFERATADSSAYVLSFEIVAPYMDICPFKGPWLPFIGNSLSCPPFSSTAVLATFVTTAVECGTTDPRTLW